MVKDSWACHSCQGLRQGHILFSVVNPKNELPYLWSRICGLVTHARDNRTEIFGGHNFIQDTSAPSRGSVFISILAVFISNWSGREKTLIQQLEQAISSANILGSSLHLKHKVQLVFLPEFFLSYFKVILVQNQSVTKSLAWPCKKELPYQWSRRLGRATHVRDRNKKAFCRNVGV